jgi:hypothetical protein
VVEIQWPAPPRGHPGLARPGALPRVPEKGTMTRRSRATARKRDAAMARNPPAPNGMKDISLQDRGLRWHGPTHALCARVPPVVGAPRRSYGYGVVAPRPTASPRVPLWGRGTVTRAIVFLPQAPRCTRARGPLGSSVRLSYALLYEGDSRFLHTPLRGGRFVAPATEMSRDWGPVRPRVARPRCAARGAAGPDCRSTRP